MATPTGPVDKNRMKRMNIRLVFDEIRRGGTLSRPELSRRTGLSIMSVGRIAEELRALGLAEDTIRDEERVYGRPPKLLRVDNQRLLCLALSLERDGVTAGLVDPCGQVVCEKKTPFAVAEYPAEAVIVRMAEAARALLETAGQNARPVVGVCVPGLIDHDAGVVQYASPFGWKDVPLRALLSEQLDGMTVMLDNDVKAWALAERQFGALRGFSNAALLSVGDGVGAAILLDGKIHRGRGNMAGEIGHVSIGDENALCECGKTGCLEACLSERALLKAVHQVQPEATLAALFEGYEASDAWAHEMIAQAVDRTCLAINLLANAYAPDAVVLCGSLPSRFPAFFSLVEAHCAKRLSPFIQGTFALKPTVFDAQGSLVGAAELAFEHYLQTVIAAC